MKCIAKWKTNLTCAFATLTGSVWFGLRQHVSPVPHLGVHLRKHRCLDLSIAGATSTLQRLGKPCWRCVQVVKYFLKDSVPSQRTTYVWGKSAQSHMSKQQNPYPLISLVERVVSSKGFAISSKKLLVTRASYGSMRFKETP